ncbi:MAG: protease pro-enzyme activation domain-containing protein, partial [Nevskiales bacterium]
MLKASRYLTSSALLLAFAAAADSPVALHDRIAAPLNIRGTVVLDGSIHPLAQARYETGRVSGDTVLHGVSLYFALSATQQADLEELLRQQQDPVSPNYQAWLTPQQYASRFGLSAADQARITSWLRGQGFSIDSVSASGNRVSFSGSAARIESAFLTELHRYQVDGESHFANATDLSVPAALSGMVLGVRGVDDFRPKPHFRAVPQFTSSQTGSNYLSPGDLAVIYNVNPLYNAGITGNGRKIAVVGQAAVNLSDIQAFRRAAGLPAKDPVLTLIPGNK